MQITPLGPRSPAGNGHWDGKVSSENITIVTIAQNEAARIRECIDSCEGLGRHLVIDGGSVDDTVAVAAAAGATVLERPFRYPADQYNYGISVSETPWVLILDADERLDPELRAEVESAVRASPGANASAYSLNRKNFVFGRWLRHGGWYPDYNIRLLDAKTCRYEDREVHARINLPKSATVKKLSGHIEHQTYDSVDQYINKLNRFTSREVLARRKPRQSRELHAQLRRVWLRTPFRPLSKFVVEYLIKGGWRDGRLGFDMAVMSAFYEFVVGVKQRQLPRQ